MIAIAKGSGVDEGQEEQGWEKAGLPQRSDSRVKSEARYFRSESAETEEERRHYKA
jgi:hypothetical protein